MDEERAAAIAEAFDLGVVAEPPAYVARGAMGEIWRLTTHRARWAVKCLFEWDPPPPIPPDLSIQLAAVAAGIRLPRPITTPTGQAVVKVGPSLVRAYDWVDLGEPLAAPVDVDVAAEIGRVLGVLHGLGLPVTEQVDSWYITAPKASVWRPLVERAMTAEVSWAVEFDLQVPLLCELGGFVAGAVSGPPIVCHRDFGPDNVLPAEADGLLVVLDWENAGALHADGEVASALLNWTTGRGQIDAEAADALITAHGRAGGPHLRLCRSSFNVEVATTLNFLKVMVDQALDDPIHRDFATRMVTSMLDGSFSRLQTNADGLVATLGLPPT